MILKKCVSNALYKTIVPKSGRYCFQSDAEKFPFISLKISYAYTFIECTSHFTHSTNYFSNAVLENSTHALPL